MDNQVDQPSPPQSVHDSEAESPPGPQHAPTDGEQLPDMEASDSDFYTCGAKALREVVLRSGHHGYSEIKVMLDDGRVEVDEKGPDGRTALSVTIQERMYDIVKLLLKKGADPNTREDRNRTPFFWATTQNICGTTPGICASDLRSRYNDMIESLLRAGADPNLTDDEENTPLALAAAVGNEEFVKLVVESGRDKINPQDDEEKTPLMRAATGGWPNCMSYLLQHPTDMASCAWWERYLQTRSRQRQKEPDPFRLSNRGLGDCPGLLLFQLDKHFLWNKVLPDGRTFLSWAVEFEDEEIVRRLLYLKPDPNVRDKTEHRMTPLIKALKLGNMDMVDLLMEKDKYSMHILVDEADNMGERQVLQLGRKFLRRGYYLNKRDLKGQNPLHIACYKGRTRFVKEFFLYPKYGKPNASVHDEDNSGKTPLQYAINNEDIVKLLIENGANLSDVSTASLFKIREPNPLCVQLTSNSRAPYQTLLLISDYDEARELWNPQSGEIKLR
jgi:ankyrin repeat protein